MGIRRCRRMQITCNNPLEKGITGDKIKEIMKRWQTEYYCFCYETGEQGTYHFHLYTKFRNPQSVETVSKAFGNAHVEMIHSSTSKQNRDYILKEGVYQDSEKKTTNHSETFYESCECPVDGKETQGARNDLEAMDKMLNDGMTPSQILLEFPFSYARYDSFENFDCVSLEMLDFENILLSRGSVILYLEKGKAFFFTSKMDIVTALLEECLEGLGERVTRNRVIYSFFELQTKKDDIVFDSIEKEIMDLEQALIATGKRDCVSEIISLRKRLMVLKKYYEQFLNVLDILVENENGIFDGKTLRSFKMLYRRTERRFQNVLNLREYVTQVRESYEAEVDISLNTTMKIFTVVTTIFLPLTLIVGWYGMNFKMPEYGWKYGYLFVCLLSLACIAGIIIFFKRKKWF